MKTCSKCEQSKPKSDFFKDKKSKDGLRSSCKACHNAYCRAWYAVHSEEHGANAREYAKAHLEQHRASAKVYREAHPDEEAKRHRVYRKAHPEEAWSHRHIGYAKRWSANGQFSLQQWTDLKAKYGNKCLCCGRKEKEIKLASDHVIPLSKGGSNWIENIQPLCQSCNSSKNKGTTDFRSPQLEWRIE